MKIKIKLFEGGKLPEFKTDGAVCADCYVRCETPIEVKPNERKLIPLGFAVELPKGYEMVIRPRSGMTKNGIGSGDATYRFNAGENMVSCSYALAYLVERAEEKKWRPYKDTDEMIEDFKKRFNVVCSMYELPLIWVQEKNTASKRFIANFYGSIVGMTDDTKLLSKLFDRYTYLDGSPCGVEE